VSERKKKNRQKKNQQTQQSFKKQPNSYGKKRHDDAGHSGPRPSEPVGKGLQGGEGCWKCLSFLRKR